jgi:hypothetical protein
LGSGSGYLGAARPAGAGLAPGATVAGNGGDARLVVGGDDDVLVRVRVRVRFGFGSR